MSKRKQQGDIEQNGVLPGILAEPAPALKSKKPPLPAVRNSHHFTTAKQIDALVQLAEEGSADMGFMARMLTLCSLPRTDPGNRLQYKRQNGPYKLVMLAGGDNKLPYGNLPRLMMAWLCTEVIRTQDRRLTLGNSLLAFMHELGIQSNSGGSRGDRTRIKQQLDRLFNCHVDMIYEPKNGPKVSTGGRIAPKTVLWWDYHQPEQDNLWQSWIEIGEELFNEIISHPVPLDMRILKAMRRSSLGLDLYMWLSYKTFALYSQSKKPEKLTWERLYAQFGADPTKAGDKSTVHDFRKDVLRELKKLQLCWPALRYATPLGCLEVHPCPPSVMPKSLTN